MGLFNSGKNDKVEKVNKYERHYNVPSSSSHRRSSKHRSHQGENGVRAMSQPPLMRIAAGYYPSSSVFPPPLIAPMAPNVIPQVRYPISQFDLSKYPSPTTYSVNPFAAATGGGGGGGAAAAGQMTPMNVNNLWNNGMGFVNNRSAFQQPLNDYQQSGWPLITPSYNGYMPPMQF
ncbi:unnamed protein product [Rotaria sp. Silwood2]|nr:unnamed protein product [Rotaria sp. Silwood2]CAF3417804.1 unnamed protein product [Rotaria sp. Silwood2]CAF4665366.1 unnamed protein product [Rotaria sp. Silwood2]CAF4689183.1 unnamed protein product [Rotaria sp. Silwood2]CAF4810187.1 unnamed protein product [Rotaria sp. Silwood2]